MGYIVFCHCLTIFEGEIRCGAENIRLARVGIAKKCMRRMKNKKCEKEM